MAGALSPHCLTCSDNHYALDSAILSEQKKTSFIHVLGVGYRQVANKLFPEYTNFFDERRPVKTLEILIGIIVLFLYQLSFAQTGLVGHWTFDDPESPLKADVGDDLKLNGGSLSVVSGPNESNGAVRIGKGSNLTVAHGISPNGGGAKVNEFSIVMDIRLPAAPAPNRWYTLYQTDISNTTDGDWFIKGDAEMGVGATGYTHYTYDKAGHWYRVAISVKNSVQYNYYSDGEKRLRGIPQSVDGRFSLGPKFLFFADQNGEDNPIDVADIKLYSRALTDEEIAALGGYSHYEEDLKITPYLQSPTSTSIYICWNAAPGEESVVEYGSDESLGNMQTGSVHIFPDSSRWWHTVKLTGLTPDATYYYRAKTGEIVSDLYKFKTQPAPGSSKGHFRLVMIGDNQRVGGGKLDEIVTAIEQTLNDLYGASGIDSVNLIINVGDIVNDGRVLQQYDQQFFKPLEPLTPYIPTMISIGNHEREADNYYHYMKYEDFAGPEGEAYYTFRIGRIRFISLNTNYSADMEDIEENFNYRNITQINWLKDVLAAAQSDSSIDWIITYFHHPGHAEVSPPSGRGYVQNLVLPTLSQYSKAEMAVYGHAHDYERGAWPNGNLRLLLIGGSGSPLERWGDYEHVDYPEIQKSFDHYCYTILDIDAANESYIARSYSLGHDDRRLPNVMIDRFYRDRNAAFAVKPALVSPDSGAYIKTAFWVEAEDLTKEYDLMSAQLQITDRKGNYNRPKVDKIQNFEDIYKDSGPPSYTPVDVNQGIELHKFMVTNEDPLQEGKTYWWRIRFRDKNMQWCNWSDEWSFTNSEPAAISESSTAAVKETKLYENYPNPFNPATSIKFALKEPGNVTLKIYSIDGRLVRTLVDRQMPSGEFIVRWDGKDDNNRPVPTGTFFYRIEAADYVKTRKALLIK